MIITSFTKRDGGKAIQVLKFEDAKEREALADLKPDTVIRIKDRSFRVRGTMKTYCIKCNSMETTGLAVEEIVQLSDLEIIEPAPEAQGGSNDVKQ
jgi:hypothetical protein